MLLSPSVKILERRNAFQRSLVSVDKGRHARQCVFSALFVLLDLKGDSPPASQKTKITRKSIPVRCKAVLTEQKCGQTMKRPQRILAVLSRTLKKYGRISARQNRVYPCQLILVSAHYTIYNFKCNPQILTKINDLN